MAKTKAVRRLRLIQSNEKSPLVKLRAGEKLEVVSVEIARGPNIKRRVGARLCGGTSTCLALVFVDRGDPIP